MSVGDDQASSRRLPSRARRLPRAQHHARDGRILHRRHDRRALTDIAGSSSMCRSRLRHLFQRGQDGDARRLRGNARGTWRGIARDRAGNGGRRTGPFARRHRACRSPASPGRTAARPEKPVGLVWFGLAHAGPRSDRREAACSRTAAAPSSAARCRSRNGAARWRSTALRRLSRQARRRSRRRASRTHRRTCGRRGRTSRPSARRGCGS